MRRAVFLDRDGTLIAERHYLRDPNEVDLLPGAADGARLLATAGYQLLIVTNQSGIGRGYFTAADLDRVHARMIELFAREGVAFERIYVAPEAPDQPSRGRKPSPQFLWDARAELNLDLARSYVVGDKLLDLECGWNAGVRRSLLVRTGYGAEVERSGDARLRDAVVVDDLSAAARWILADGPPG